MFRRSIKLRHVQQYIRFGRKKPNQFEEKVFRHCNRLNGLPDILSSLVRSKSTLNQFLTLLLKLVSKMIKYIVELTQLYMGKVWDLKSISFAIISFIHYSVKLYVEIVFFKIMQTFCVVLVKNSVIPIFFMVDVLYSCYHLLKMLTKFNDTIKVYSILKK